MGEWNCGTGLEPSVEWEWNSGTGLERRVEWEWGNGIVERD